MKKVAYVLTIGALFAIAGALYIKERIALRIMRKRLVTYTGDPWACDDE